MATYPGMSLGGEIRESVSLDEDDLSDVEDEVFIRDGKNGYKFVEDAGLKRPLMAPRRKMGRPDLTSRLKNRPPCKALCKPCCYVFGALFILIGLIVLVVILVSMFPLPIDKIRVWISSKGGNSTTLKILPCSNLKVTDVWTVSFPKYISESPIRALDINNDGVDDFIFGHGTALENALHPKLFCPIFMGVSPPCEGGVMALNGVNGKVLWRQWFLYSIFTIVCSVDVNNDKLPDCVVTGKGGIFSAIDSKDGTIIWSFKDPKKEDALVMDVYAMSFVQDINKDGIQDIIASHTGQKDRARHGHLLIISGKDGKLIRKVSTPENMETYYMPQVLNNSAHENLVLFGTGSPTSPGNLSIVSLKDLDNSTMAAKTIYQDKYKGLVSPSVLVDITGDGQVDIISAAFNSTVIAFDGNSFEQIWNFTIPNSETLSVPIPGYFNNDNITDFFVKYQTGKEFPLYYYSQAFIIDGKTGTPMYNEPIIDTMGSQIGGLTLRMEGYGYDLFLYWIVNCIGYEGVQTPFQFNTGSNIKDQSNADLCKLRFNSTAVAKLYALNQFDQPPGLEIYSSDNRTLLEFKNVRTAVEEATEYFHLHPENDFKTDTAEDVEEILKSRPMPASIPNTYGVNVGVGESSFRHKSNHQGLIKDFGRTETKKKIEAPIPKIQNNYNDEKKFEMDYDQDQDWNGAAYDLNDPNSPMYEMDTPYYPSQTYNNPNGQYLVQDKIKSMNRDPRSKSDSFTKTPLELEETLLSIDPTKSTVYDRPSKKARTLKKNLADATHGVYGLKNVRLSRNRLLHDLNSSPNEILMDTYFKNRERQLRKSRFEQRDIKAHKDKLKDNEEVKKILENERQNANNVSENLWHLETEKEAEDRENGYWRNKRASASSSSYSWIPRITSVAVLTDSADKNPNAIDLVFLTYWVPPKSGAQVLLDQDVKCISDKLKEAIDMKDSAYPASVKDIEKICLENRLANATKPSNAKTESKQIPYYNQILQIRAGQMTVYKIRIECQCEAYRKGERCAKFLPSDKQTWGSFLGKMGDGFFN